MRGRKIVLRGLAFAFAAAAAVGGAKAGATSIEGIWQNRNATLEVRIVPCGRHYCGIVVGARGEAVADARLSGTQRLVGTQVLKDYAPAADGLWRGSVFVPELGRHLSSRIRFLDADTVQLSACALGGLICKTKVWHRLAPPHGLTLARGG